MMVCPKCGNSNEDSASFCSKCGVALVPGAQGLSTSGVRHSPDSTDFYKATIGPKNQDYYIRHFLRFDTTGKAQISWHWPAFFTTLYWLIYRKMWLNAFLYWLLPFALLIPTLIITALLGDSGGYLITIVYFLYLAGIFLLPPMYANAFYYNHCRKKITESRSSSNDVQWQLGELSGKGGVSNVVIIFIIILSLVALAGILAAIAIPQFTTYKNRTSMAQAMQVGRNATEHVTNYYNQNKKVPLSFEESGYKDPLPSLVKKISIDSQTGTITVTMANEPFDGKNLLFILYTNTDKQISWKCVSNDIQEQYLPKDCRRSK